MIALRSLLRPTNGNDTRSHPLPRESQANKNKLGVSLCTYLCAHRLVDVMALVEGRVNRVGVPKYRKQGNFGDVTGKVRLSNGTIYFYC
jgi:hypothetical protein